MDKFLNKIDLQAIKWDWQILTALILAWLVVLVCSISSVLNQPFDKARRTFWIFIITAIPVFGLLAYLPFSFKAEDLPQIFRSQASAKQRTRKNRSR
jgi:hypothetical protein